MRCWVVVLKFGFFNEELYWVELLSRVRLFAAPWTVAYQASPSMGFPGKNTGVGSHFLLQGIFLTQGSNPGLHHCRWTLYRLSHREVTLTIVGIKRNIILYINSYTLTMVGIKIAAKMSQTPEQVIYWLHRKGELSLYMELRFLIRTHVKIERLY